MSHKFKEFKEFFATSWSIDNKTSIYVAMVFISLLGYVNYVFIPKEQFPEVVIPYIMVNTVYPGTSPSDMENLVTRPIEKELKSLSNVKKISSNSLQDFSNVVVEFDPDIPIPEAKQRVRDAVDKAKGKLPTDLPDDPSISDINFSEFPVMFINISGNYTLEQLKKYAEEAQDRLETVKGVTRVDIVGGLEKEIQINADMYKMQLAKVTFDDISRAVSSENITISAGNITTNGMRNNIRIKGQFNDVNTLKNIVIQTSAGGFIKLSDIADVREDFEEQESFARLNGANVITMNVIKKSGANLLDASDEIKRIVKDELTNKIFPSDLNISISGDMSNSTRNTLEDLNNTIIIGFILVTILLMFYMGFTNAFFVGISVPLSMALAYIIIPMFGFTMNMIVMFAFIFALGIVVDDAIVVIENTHRMHKRIPDIKLAAKYAAGEVFMPILSGTLTTLAPFFPLVFWPGIVGQFMHYLPATLIVTLLASLFVAYVFNPVFAVSFMQHEYDDDYNKKKGWRQTKISMMAIAVLALLFYTTGHIGIGNFLVFAIIMILVYHFFISKWIVTFQEKTWPKALHYYEKTLRYVVIGNRPYWLLGIMIGMFFLSFVAIFIAKPKVLFFPENDPNNIYVYIKMPEGTNQNVTDSVARIAEKRVYQVLGTNNPDVESIITNITIGAEEEGFGGTGTPFNKGKISINFVETKYRKSGKSTSKYLEELREVMVGIPGPEITVDKNNMGPPTGKPVNIEIASENIETLIHDAYGFRDFIASKKIPGIEELKTDFEINSPEIVVKIDRDRAQREGLSTAQIGTTVRTALFGKEVSKFKREEDEYPIMLRFDDVTRNNINALTNLDITYRDMNSGQLRSIPLSTVTSIEYTSSYAGIKRQDLKRVITVYSNVRTGYSANEIVSTIKKMEKEYRFSEGTTYKFTGEQEDQAETTTFFIQALFIAMGIIFFILITQFDSVSKTIIILSEVVFSFIGVLFGLAIFQMDIVIMMTGLGIVALGGIVVRNGILIIEFTDELKARGYRTREAIVEAGKSRITPVFLTASATVLGLIPLAVGMNINFETLFTHLDPQIYFGGDNVMFWGPLSWTIIFGLTFSTFLTLVFLPAMYFMDYTGQIAIKRWLHRLRIRRELKDIQ